MRGSASRKVFGSVPELAVFFQVLTFPSAATFIAVIKISPLRVSLPEPFTRADHRNMINLLFVPEISDNR